LIFELRVIPISSVLLGIPKELYFGSRKVHYTC